MSISFEKGENYSISKFAEVKEITYNSGKKIIKEFERKNIHEFPSKRISKNEYVIKETGEICEYVNSEYKTVDNIKKCLKEKVKPILENNFFGGKSEIFVTLTYSKNMDDFKQLSSDFREFWRRITRRYKSTNRLACVYVKEMQQKRKSWHIHALIKDLDGNKLYIPSETMGLIWKNGFTSVSRVLSGFALDYREINEEKKMEENFFIQNERWNINKIIDYMCKLKTKEDQIPASGRLYGIKGGLKPPTTEFRRYGDIMKETKDTHRLVNDETLLIRNTDTNCIINHIHTQTFIEHKSKNI